MRDVRNHLRLQRSELGLLADHRDIKGLDFEGRARNRLASRRHKFCTAYTLVGRVSVGKLLTNVWLPKCTKNRVHHRVVDRIAIGVAHGTFGVVERHAAEDERAAAPWRGLRFESMEVIAVTDAKRRGGFHSAWHLGLLETRAIVPQERVQVGSVRSSYATLLKLRSRIPFSTDEGRVRGGLGRWRCPNI